MPTESSLLVPKEVQCELGVTFTEPRMRTWIKLLDEVPNVQEVLKQVADGSDDTLKIFQSLLGSPALENAVNGLINSCITSGDKIDFFGLTLPAAIVLVDDFTKCVRLETIRQLFIQRGLDTKIGMVLEKLQAAGKSLDLETRPIAEVPPPAT